MMQWMIREMVLNFIYPLRLQHLVLHCPAPIVPVFHAHCHPKTAKNILLCVYFSTTTIRKQTYTGHKHDNNIVIIIVIVS